MKIHTILLCIEVLFAVVSVKGSIIEINSSSSSVEPPLTSNLTLKCGLRDTPSIGGPGSIIGKKKRSVSESTSIMNATALSTQHTTRSNSRGSRNNRKVGVTNTTENAEIITSIVVYKDNIEFATISEHVSAKSLVSSPTLLVTGDLSGKSGERGYLQMSWQHPTKAVAGNYRCEIDALDLSGHSYDYAQTTKVDLGEVAFADVIDYVQMLEREKDNMVATIDTMTRTEENMNATIADMQHFILSMNASIDIMKQNEDSMNTKINTMKQNEDRMDARISTLESQMAKALTRVIFSASVNTDAGGLIIKDGQYVKFDRVHANIGGSYNSSNGIFTSPMKGYYAFSMNFQNYGKTYMEFYLSVNGNNMMHVSNEKGVGHFNIGNDIILKLDVNDQVKIISDSDESRIYQHVNCNFNGQLLLPL